MIYMEYINIYIYNIFILANLSTIPRPLEVMGFSILLFLQSLTVSLAQARAKDREKLTMEGSSSLNESSVNLSQYDIIPQSIQLGQGKTAKQSLRAVDALIAYGVSNMYGCNVTFSYICLFLCSRISLHRWSEDHVQWVIISINKSPISLGLGYAIVQ